jgi:RHS repeat-associated protein
VGAVRQLHLPKFPARACIAVLACLATVAGLLSVLDRSASASTPPTQISFTNGQPGNGDPGSTLSPQPKVRLEKSDGTLQTDATSTISLTLNAVAISATSGTFVKGDLSGCAVDTVTGGVVSFKDCAVSRPGKYTLTASDDSDSGVASVTSDAFYVSGPAQLVFTQSPGGGAAAAEWSSGNQPVVTVEDAQGHPVADTTEVGVAIQGGTGTPAAVLSCHDDGTAANVIHFGSDPVGAADYSNCKIDKSGTGYQLYAVDPTDKLISAPSSTFSVSAGDVSQIAFFTQPAGANGGEHLASQPVVALEDAGGNIVTDATDHITLDITSGTGASGADLTCTSTDVAPSGGKATFAGCAIDNAGTGYQLRAHDSTASLHVDSTAFNITTGPAAQIAFSRDPSGGASGTAFDTQPRVSLTDAGGNPVGGNVTLSITDNTGTPGAQLSCATDPLGTAAGTATFASCAIDKSGADYQLHAVSGSLHADSAAFTVGGGTAAALHFTSGPGTADTGGSTFATSPVVHVTDAGGQGANGSVTLSIATGTGAPDATLTCTDGTTRSSSSFDATFSGCSIDKAGHGYRLLATLDSSSPAVVATSDPFDVAVGDAAGIAFTQSPGDSTGGHVWAHQPVVTVEDLGGNAVSDATGNVTLSRTTGTGSGALDCQDVTVPLQVGRAFFAGCSIDKTASAYTLTATWNGHSATSDPFAITAGPATALVFTGEPGDAAVGAPLAPQPVVTFEDAGGNRTTNGAGTVTMDITVAPSAALTGCGSASAASTGSATFSGCSVSASGAGFTLSAAGGGMQTESLPFNVRPATAPTVGHAPMAVPLAETFGGQVYGVNPTDIVDDVNTATGSLTFGSTDLRVAGIGKPFLMARTYNSADTTGGFFGPGWSSLFDVGVTVVPDKTATVRGEDGQQTVWTWNGKKRSFVAPPGARGSLDCGGNTGNHCRYTRVDGSTWDVNYTEPGGGQLQTYKAQDSQGLSFDWTPGHVVVTVQSTSLTPYRIDGTINAQGRITSLTTPAGRTVTYGYDSAGRLTSVRDTAGRTWTFGYEGTSSSLTTQTDPDGHERLAATYGSAGRVTTVQIKGSDKHADDTFGYDASGVTTRRAMVDVGGSDQRVPYTYGYRNNSLVAQALPSGATTQYEYDARGNLVTTVDPLGWAETLKYSSGNDLVEQDDALGGAVTMTYDSKHRITSTTDALGHRTTYGYSGPYLSSIAQPVVTRGTGVTSLSYNDLGELTLVRGPQGQQAFGYDAFGNQTSARLQTLAGAAVNGPGTSATFDEAGRKLTSTDADGRTTASTYDAAGDLLSVQLPGGGITTYTYSGAADLTGVTVGSQTTTYRWDEASKTRTTRVGSNDTTDVYDPSGNMLTETTGGTTKSNVYDGSSQLVQTTDASGITTRYAYDLAGNGVLITSSAGDVMRKQFDALHHPVRQVLDGAVTSTTYDPAGNVLSTTDPQGRRTAYTYNLTGHVATAVAAAGTGQAAATTYAYDLDGNVTAMRDPEGHATTYAYDAANRRTASTFAGNVTTFGYDDAGNVTSITDPDGRRTTYELDDQNHPVRTTYSWNGDGYSVTQAYDAQGRRTEMTDPTGTHHYTYDAAGDLTSASTGNDTFSYDYSTAGKIAETYPDGTVVTYGLDDARNVMSVESGTKGSADYVHAAYLRNAQRFTTGVAFSNGVLETRQLDQAGHVLDQSLTVGGQQAADDAFTYDAAGDRLSQVDNVAGGITTNSYGYDNAGRLSGFSTSTDTTSTDAIDWPTVDLSTTAPNGSGPGLTPTFTPSVPVSPSTPTSVPAAYTYDGAGNQTSSAGGATTYSNNSADELSSISGAGARSATYDGAGNLTSLGAETLSYDAANHLVGVTMPSGKQISYSYDGDGNRISKSADSSTTDYVWDPASSTPQLDIERTDSGDLIRRYIYGDGPVAMQTPTATFFYQLDPLGSVQELTNTGGALAAAYHYDGYGKVTTDGDNPPDNPLLFQGGFLDSDTGLYDMGHRNYDPALGRFTQREPLDRPSGTTAVSPYVFVDDRPTVFVDPTGLFPTAADLFWSHQSIGGNVAQDANYVLVAGKVGFAAGKQIVAFAAEPEAYLASKWQALQDVGSAIKTKAGEAWDYVAGESSQALESAEEEIATNVGETATADAEAAGTVLEREAGVLGELGGEAGEVAGESAGALAEAGEAAKFGGIALAVVGIGLQTWLTVEDCMHDTVSKCVADAVSTAVSIVFTVACTVATEGVGAVVCGLVGAALSVALSEVISRYGPQIAAGFVTAYNSTAAALTTAADWVSDTAQETGAYIAQGFNQAAAAVKSGFDDAINTLVDAGYSAAQLAVTLADDFKEGIDAAVNALVGFGYQIADIATALFDGLQVGLDTAVQALKDTYNYTVTAISDALQTAYDATAAALGSALKAAAYAVDEVARGLKSAYDGLVAGTDAAVAAVLDGLNYAVDQIAGALQTVYQDADQVVATVLNGLNKGVVVVAAALQSIYHDIDSAVASALDFASYTVNQIATALKDVYDDAAAIAAGVIDTLNHGIDALTTAMKQIYDLADVATTQILKNLTYGATAIAGALRSIYDDTAQLVTDALHSVAFAVDAVSNALQSAFSTLDKAVSGAADAVAGYLYSAGYALVDVGFALKDTFDEVDHQVVRLLDTLSSNLDLAATTIATVFNEGAQAVASALQAASYAVDAIAGVLQNAFAEAAEAAAQILKNIGVAIGSIISALQDVFGEAENAIASVLNDIGEALSDIANTLESAFGQAASDVAGVLQSIGISTDLIDSIGGAFADFGNAVASGFEDAWDTVSSWF